MVGALGICEAPVYVTPSTTSLEEAQGWFGEYEGAGLDGVVAKPADVTYRPDVRAMYKVKHERTADCVVAGFRWHKTGGVIGSLLLGLYNTDGSLQHVGVSASFPMSRRAELVDELAPYRIDDLTAIPGPSGAGGSPRGRTTPRSSQPLEREEGSVLGRGATQLVVEVAYDHMEGTRFRHTAQFRRWRRTETRDPARTTN